MVEARSMSPSPGDTLLFVSHMQRDAELRGREANIGKRAIKKCGTGSVEM